MGEWPPIACTLTAADLRDRQGAWAKLLRSGLVDRDRVAGGIRLHAARGAGAALVELIDLERECCAWIQFKVTRDPIAGEVDDLLIAEGEGEEVRRDVRLRVGLLEVRTPYGCGLRSMLSRAPIVSESQGRQTSPGS